MREIKFRAFVDGEMYPVTNLDYIQDGSGIIAHIHIKGINQEIPSGQFKLMQYTGLKDKNSVEIYEGDIFKDDYWWVGRATVEFANGMFGFECGDEAKRDFRPIIECEHIEVIGNIFEGVEK